MITEANKVGLNFEDHLLKAIKGNYKAKQHEEYQGFFKLLGDRVRKIYKHTFIHKSVKERYDSIRDYKPDPIKQYVKKYGWSNLTD